MRRAAVVAAIFAGSAIATAACAQLVGIEGIHDDAPDTGSDTSTGDAPAGDVAPDVAPDAPTHDATVEAAADGGVDAPADATQGDVAQDASTIVLDPSLACPPLADGGVANQLLSIGTSVAIAVDEHYVYYGLYGTSTTGVFRCDVNGCDGGTGESLAPDYAASIAADGTDVGWIAYDSSQNTYSLAVAGPDSEQVLAAPVGGQGMIVGSPNRFWVLATSTLQAFVDDGGSVSASGSGFTVPTQSMGSPALAASDVAVALLVENPDAGDVYVCTTAACDAGSPTAQYAWSTASGSETLVAIDDESLYYLDPTTSNIMWCPVSSCHVPAVLVPGVFPSAMFAADAGLYWGGNSPALGTGIFLTARDGGTTLMASLDLSPSQITANSACLYWVVGNLIPRHGDVYSAPLH